MVEVRGRPNKGLVEIIKNDSTHKSRIHYFGTVSHVGHQHTHSTNIQLQT